MATATFQSILPNILPFRIPHTLEGVLGRVLGIEQIGRIYDELRAMGDERPIADRLLDFLDVTYISSKTDLARIPESGAAIVTVNHPFGILEGAILASMLRKIRPDVRFLANGILTAVPELHDLLIPVDVTSGRSAAANGRGLKRCLEYLKSGGMLVVFPAGEVSHFHWKDRAVTDAEWNPAVARMAAICRTPVIPVHVAGANGPMFQLAGMAHPGFRTALLGRELLNKRGSRVDIRIGAAVTPETLIAIPTAREQAEYLRWRCYLLAGRESFKPKTAADGPRAIPGMADPRPIAAAMPAARIASEIAALPADCRLGGSGDLEVYLASASQIPAALRELGRLREVTFRAAGEGTGQPLDLDEFDEHYFHLFVWQARKQELVGAYRLACTDVVRRQAGVRGLYTASLFRYGDSFLDKMGPAVELGRSFIREEYQKGFSPLLLLWKGIGAFIARNPRCKILFGPVSISNRYQAVSRELMVLFLEKYALLSEWAKLVRRRRGLPERHLTGARRPVFPDSGFDLEHLSAVMSDLEQAPTGIPVLLRQYLKLGGKLLGFNVDAKFADALDGLIVVDLTRTEPKLLERYLGKREAVAFLEFQKGTNGTH